jgi:hypothetical protein
LAMGTKRVPSSRRERTASAYRFAVAVRIASGLCRHWSFVSEAIGAGRQKAAVINARWRRGQPRRACSGVRCHRAAYSGKTGSDELGRVRCDCPSDGSPYPAETANRTMAAVQRPGAASKARLRNYMLSLDSVLPDRLRTARSRRTAARCSYRSSLRSSGSTRRTASADR